MSDDAAAPAPRDLGLEAQKAAEAHLAACQEALYSEDHEDGVPDSPACAPFCGCETCVVREVLYAAWQVLEEAVASGQMIRLTPCPDAPPADLLELGGPAPED